MQRDHYRLLDAAGVVERGMRSAGMRFDLCAWLGRKFGKQPDRRARPPLGLRNLTLAQVRQARRSLNAWGHCMRPAVSQFRVVTQKSTNRTIFEGVK